MFNKNRIKESFGDRVLLGIIYLLLSAIMLTVLYPLIYIISSSFSSPNAVVSGQVWLFPVEVSFRAYESIFHSSQLMLGYYNSIIYTVVGTFINVLFTVLLAFPLSQKGFVGRKIIMILMMFTLFFDGGLIPTYLLVKNLHMLDTRWALVAAWSVIDLSGHRCQDLLPDLHSRRACGSGANRRCPGYTLPGQHRASFVQTDSRRYDAYVRGRSLERLF